MPNDEPIASLLRSSGPLTPARYGAEAPDALLLDRFVEQWDQAAFHDLVVRHGPMVLGVCRRILRDHHAAEDVFQATFLVPLASSMSFGICFSRSAIRASEGRSCFDSIDC